MKRKKTATSDRVSILNFLWRRKVWTIVVGLLALVAIIFTGIDSYHSYQAYRARLTEKDFSAIEGMAEDVIKAVGGTEVTKYNTCSYERPGVYADLHLFCTVRMIAYMAYEDNANTIAIANDLKTKAGMYGEAFTHSVGFYENPQDSQAFFSVNLKKPLPAEQCSFSLYTNKRAKDAVLFVPKKIENNLIAVSFECSAQSRGEYFPVTYRQGP